MTTQVIGVDIVIQSNIANTRTYALACAESINVSEYANQVIVQQFFQRYKDDPNYRLAVVELKDKNTGQSHQGEDPSRWLDLFYKYLIRSVPEIVHPIFPLTQYT